MNGCFGCDPANTAGLGMTFSRDAAGRLTASCRPSSSHRGLGRIVNGGLIATFAEELAAAQAGAHGDAGLVVSRIEVDYERPAYVEDTLTGVVTASSRDGRNVAVTVEVHAAGQRVAMLRGSFALISESRLQSLAGITLAEAPACLTAGRSRADA